MINFTKLLKIGLPVATLATATIITATLLFSSREDLKLTNINEETLENYDKELDPYKEELIKQADEPASEEDQKNEQAENEKKAEAKIKEQLQKPDTKKLIEELLDKPEELAKKLSLDSDITISQEQVKKIIEKIPELAKQVPGQEQGDRKTQEEQGPSQTEQQDLDGKDPLVPSEEVPPSQPSGELSQEEPDKGAKRSDPEEAKASPPLAEEKRDAPQPPSPKESLPSEEETVVKDPQESEDLSTNTESDTSASIERPLTEPTEDEEDDSMPEDADNGHHSLSSGSENEDMNQETRVSEEASESEDRDASDLEAGGQGGGSEDGDPEGTGDSHIPLAKWQEIQDELLSVLSSLGRKVRI